MRRLKQIFWTLMLALAAFFGYMISHWLKSGSALRFGNTQSVVEQVQTLSQLVTVKYVMQKIEIVDSPPESTLGKFVQGDNHVLLLAQGIVKAGIDLKKIQPGDVTVSGKKISIKLPLPQITDAYLDDAQTKVVDWQKGFLREFDKDLEQTTRQNAVDDLQRAARENGILNDANERARLELNSFFEQAGFDPVEFR
jgi:hypothetical protein